MELVLVSSCLLGELVRHNGGDKRCDHLVLKRWISEGRVVSICPEVSGGLPVPRPPAEISGGAGGLKVLEGEAVVVDDRGRDVTAPFLVGAERALAIAREKDIRLAVLKEGSPSCGTSFVYDGSFTSTPVPDAGVTAACLRRAGLQVFSEDELETAAGVLARIEIERERP